MKNKILISLLLSFFLSGSIYSQEKVDKKIDEDTKQVYKHGLGLAAGFTTGYGLSYRFMHKKFKVQAAFAPFKDVNSSRYSAGISFYYNLIETRRVNFFVYQGNHYHYTSDSYYKYNYITNTSTLESEEIEESINNGVGLGIEIIVFDRLSLNFMTGYASFNSLERINLSAETGIFFLF